ncbi:MAG: divergent PAP2 family protein [Eubacteriales bacterium]
MTFLTELFTNKIFIAAAVAWFVAQVLKTLLCLFFERKFIIERLVGSGGMPSSHSSTVCALATATGMQYGGGSFEFAVTCIFAIIVMYDARGVRMETGKQSKILNEMVELFYHMGKDFTPQEKLSELVGHTPLQVLMGAILGIGIGVLYMI